MTGSSGAIGSAVVSQFQAAGLHVVGVDRRPPQSGGPDTFVQGDVLDESCLNAAAAAAASVGVLRHVAHVAGGALATEVAASLPSAIPVEVFEESLAVNLRSAWVLLRAVEQHLLASDGNRSVTFCSSRNALSGHGIPPYSASKAGLMGLAHPVAVQLGRFGVRVNAVAPGQIATPYAVALHADQPGHFEAIAARSALGRLASEEEVARAFRCLALDLTAMTGQLLVVDAGGEVWRG